jgi:hypothetical protein
MPFNYDYGFDDDYEMDMADIEDAAAEAQYLAEMEEAFGPYVASQETGYLDDFPF